MQQKGRCYCECIKLHPLRHDSQLQTALRSALTFDTETFCPGEAWIWLEFTRESNFLVKPLTTHPGYTKPHQGFPFNFVLRP
jgi:hypothetical protein